MNIQTEHLENHTARLTVEVEQERLDKARQAAVRKIAKAVEIPGFRKGKAPAHLVTRYVGEARVLEEALEDLGQTIYRETLDQADVKPYGPGALEDVKYEPTLTFIYTVPLQPSVKLNDYRSTTLEYTAPVIDDAQVEQALKQLQDREAASEDSQEPAVIGNRLTLDVHSFIVDEDHDHDDDDDDDDDSDIHEDDDDSDIHEADDDDSDIHEADDDDDDDDDDHHNHDHDGEPFIHEHDLRVILSEGDDEPIGPGFTAAMQGATVGETREFRLTYPTKEEDPDINDEVAGKSVDFVISVKKIENVTLPELNDEFAASVADLFADPNDEVATVPNEEAAEAAEGDESEAPAKPTLTLAQLREKVRESLEREAKQVADQTYADQVLDTIVQQAEIAYPEMMLNEQLDSMIENLDQRLRQQGITLDQFMSLTRKSREDIRNEYLPSAEEALKRSLTLFEIAVAEKIQVTPEEFEAHIDRTMQRLGFASPEFRKTFDNPSVRDNILNRLLQDKTFERIAAIGKGEAPELPAEEAPADEPAADTDSTPNEE